MYKKNIEFLNRQIENLRNEKLNLVDIVNSQEITVDESERLQRETLKNEQTRSKLILAKNEKFKLKYDLIQNLEETTNDVQ